MRSSMLTAAAAVAIAVAAVGSAEAQAPAAGTHTPAAGTHAPAAGTHTMEGKVTKVDPKRGWVDVKTAEGSMKLHFPPTALDGVKTGDSVTIELGMSASARPAAAVPKTR